MVISLLGHNESPMDIEALCKAEGLKFFWIELAGANKDTLNAATFLPKKLRELFKALSDEKHTAVVHCAAGIHRTGTICYTLLRLGGMSATEAMSALKEMREETAKGVGKWRIDFGESLVGRSRIQKNQVKS